ncbi:glutamyl-tRNA(Gln) amidotransferase [Colletotrichum orchidophilum]|uniref:Glutamyl-tRNA(Gln) amidotransferase n=1 Tax=Colletotrichum orchidophilum TaxID=1209926 RepID=A0A1G4B4M1_9PEZI|nr:glutamyl-tRNA(Gln) amidotransferase [Colletotrichum orchidophilum]OHE96222.1 glutamyl-tRNA(Gln) amidotransferase [Colletotrichum orchidophilum]
MHILLVSGLFCALLGLSMGQKFVSTVVRLGDVAYYMHFIDTAHAAVPSDLPSDRTAEPCTVLDVGSEPLDVGRLSKHLENFVRRDDVWSYRFLSSVVIQTFDATFQLGEDVGQLLRDHGAQFVSVSIVGTASSGKEPLPEGPYFIHHGKLHLVYRLYPDSADAFMVATVPTQETGTYRSLDGAAYGEQYPSALTVAVPSRLYYKKTAEKPYAGYRLAVKDIIDLKGLKTGASSRAYTSLYPVRSSNAPALQKLIDLGFEVVGKLKTTQFADSEWPTCDWVDYQAPFNPRGDGYLTTSGSSAGSAAAIASYPWLDFTLGTDTLGSIRAPAAAQGVFGMRSSLGAASFEGVVPYSPMFDTLGGFARTAEEFSILAKALYGGSTSRSDDFKKPTRILYPTDYWPVSDENSQKVFDKFIARLESFLGVQRTHINLARLWKETNPEGVETPLNEYFNHVFEWSANPDQWTGFFKEFVEEYEKKNGKPPVLNPQLRFKKEYLPTITLEQQKEGRRLMDVYQKWFYQEVMPPSQNGYSETILVLPWTTGKPDYRDKYRDGPQKFTGVGFFFYNVGPYAHAPELIVPVEPTSYKSKFTGMIEDLPAAVGLIGSKGSDIMLTELLRVMMADAEVVYGGASLPEAQHTL